MKKKRKFIIPIFISIIMLIGIGLCIYFTSPVNNSDAIVEFTINNNSTTESIIDDLYENDLIKNKIFAKLYLKINKFDTIKAGNFELMRSMSLKEIFNTITNSSNIREDTVVITFLEGKTVEDYAEEIEKNLNIKKEAFLNTFKDNTYINSLIERYWFLDSEILNSGIYYSLEGYLAPDTYMFYNDASATDIIEKMLDQEETILDEYKKQIEASNKSVHYFLTMASIAELEGSTLEDRKNIVGVFYNRLNNNDKLGSDVTTYYASHLKLYERDLLDSELNSVNGYNTIV